MARPRVAIVGGGFSGAVTAVQLAKLAPIPVDIAIIEPRAVLGGGVAYSSMEPAHRINVPAARMAVFTRDPLHFERWLKRDGALDDDPAAIWPDGQLYPGRAVFGRYLASLVEDARCQHPSVAIDHVRSRVTSIAPEGAGYRLELDTGDALAADLVVLAVSHPPPVVPRQLQAFADDIIADPWAAGALDRITPGTDILIVGTGLTMADIVASLDPRCPGSMSAFSRRGIVSRGHAKAPHAAFERFGLAPAPTTTAALVTAVRRAVAEAAAGGLPWQAVFDDLRLNAPHLWQALPLVERRRFLRHLRSFWDAHRYRVAPQVEAVLERRRAEGSLRIMAASLGEVTRRHGRFEVTLHPRATPEDHRLRLIVDHIIVTTGPGHASIVELNPALAALARVGQIVADTLGLGIAVDRSSHAIGANGVANPTLLVAGPLARATFGELMGLPQVSDHAALVAGEVADWLGNWDRNRTETAE